MAVTEYVVYDLTVAKPNIFIYNEPYSTNNSNAYVILNKGDTFKAIKYGDQNDDHWYKVLDSSNEKLVGKFIYRRNTADGYDIEIIDQKEYSVDDDETSGGSGTSPGGGSGSGSGDGSGSSSSSEEDLKEIVGKDGAVKYTTEATVDVNGNPISRDADGNIISFDDSDTYTIEEIDEMYQLDDSFFEEYAPNMSSDEYFQHLADGLDIEDLRGIFGLPHQFLPITDIRIDSASGDSNKDLYRLGRVYSEKILKTIPLLLITPGIPSFMAGFSKEQRETLGEQFFRDMAGGVVKDLTGEYSGKYYSLKYAYVDYFKYVNAMLRSAAVFLGIDKEKVNGKQLGQFNWLYNTSSDGSDIWGHKGLGKFIGPYAGCIAFYADCGNQINDSFSNNTTPSQLSNTLNSLSDTGRELNFLVGNVGSLAGLKVNALTGEEDLLNNMDVVKDAVDDLLGSGNIMSNILNKAQTILAGGRLVFPEIWSDSSFGRSYSCSMKLVSPSGDKLSIFLNILVPIYHLLGMVLPRQSIQQSYFSPFLLRCYYKGLFNVDMGIMTGLSITKGAEAEWTVDGLPTVADISFEIKDLYEGMFMSRAEDERDLNILSNITELDYIANSCGININDQEVKRTLKLWWVLKANPIKTVNDLVANGIFGNITQFFNQKLNNLFGVF